MYLIIKVLFEKTDFLKDLYVAAFFPHSSKTHAFIFWMSIITPTFGILLYFWETNKIMQFIPSFFGFTELMKDKQKNKNALSVLELNAKRGRIMYNYQLIKNQTKQTQDIEN